MREGDRGFADFVRARTPALLRSAYLLTGDQQLAEDLVQEALARTSLHWARVVSRGDPEPYVRTVMHRLRVAWWRRRWLAEEPAEDVPEPRAAWGQDVDGTARTAVDRLIVREALQSLAPGQRAVVVLRYLDDLSESQVAGVLGCSVGTVRSQQAKALARLRRTAPHLVDPEEVAT